MKTFKEGRYYTIGEKLIISALMHRGKMQGRVVQTKIHPVVQISEVIELTKRYGKISETTDEDFRRFNLSKPTTPIWSNTPLEEKKI